MTDSTSKPTMGMPFDFSQFGQMGAGGLESITEASRKMLEASATMNKEIFEFANARLQEDVATQQKLLQSSSFEDMQKTYAEFVQNASQQYVNEMQKLFAMATETMSGAAASMGKPAKK